MVLCLDIEFLLIQAINGGKDGGALGPNGTRESDVVLQVGYRLSQILNKLGYEVDMSRGDNSQLSILNRINMANQLKSDIFISIHCNAATSNAHGAETWYAKGSKNGTLLAGKIQESIVNHLLPKNRGIKDDSTNSRFKNGIPVLRQTKMPAVLVELDFISNSDIEMLLSNPKIQEMYASAIAVGVDNYFSVL